MQQISCRWSVAFALAVGLLSGTAQAHFPWVVPEHAAPVSGEPIKARVLFGHGPEDARSLDASRVSRLRLIGTDGSLQALQPDGEDLWRTEGGFEGVGSALLSGLQTPGYWSRTPNGGQRQSRETLDNVSECSYSHNGFKALLGEGRASAGALSVPMGHPLEIVPRAVDPADDSGLPIELRLRGAPTEGVVTVTAIGADEVAEVAVGADGAAHMPLNGEGPWLLHAQYSEAYGDDTVCDERVFNATLYVGIR